MSSPELSEMDIKTTINNCEFSDQIISIVYGEIEDSDKKKFELHTLECSSCADAISEFMFVRTLIQDWRDQDFALLSAPNITLPAQKQVANNNDESFFGKVFAQFNLSSLKFLAPAAALILAVCGVVWFMSGTSNNSEIAANYSSKSINDNNSKTIIPENKENSSAKEASGSEAKSDSVAGKSRDSAVADIAPTSPKEVFAAKTANREKPIAKQSKQSTKSSNQPIPVTLKKPASNKLKNQKLPTLYAEEDEADNVRLSDILEEVSMK